MKFSNNGRLFTIHGVLPHTEKGDIYIVIALTIFLTVFRFILVGCNHHYFKHYSSVFGYLIDNLKLAKHGKTPKLSESLWYLMWHSFSLITNLILLKREYGTHDNHRWLYYFIRDLNGIWFFTDSIDDVQNHRATWPYLSLSRECRLFILLSIAFWISCAIYINFETRRSDLRIMCFHHITTFSLMIVAYVYNFNRISLIVVLIHDIPDVLLYLSKSESYMAYELDRLLSISFLLYAFSHFFTRFILLGYYVAYPLFFTSNVSTYTGYTIQYLWEFPGGIVCPIAIVILTIMNIYWLNLILQILTKYLSSTSKLHDTREDDD